MLGYQIDLEMAEVENRLLFWRQQQQYQEGSGLAKHVDRVVAGYEAMLKELQIAREGLNA